MNRGDARDQLRRRLQEYSPDLWLNTDLNRALNFAAMEMQKEVMKVDPEAFRFVDRTDIVNATTFEKQFYEFPAGCWYESAVQILGDDGKYGKPLVRIPYLEVLDRTDGEPRYARFDRSYFLLSPPPDADRANGIQLTWTPTLTMANNIDELPFHTGLHLGVVMFAEMIALGDSGEARDDTLKDLARIINSIPQYYLASGSTPSALIVDLDKGY
jgi:hypothetical protein